MDTHVTGKCPQCGAAFRLRVHAVGRRAKCKTCHQVFVVPGKHKANANDDDVMSWLDRPTKQEADEPQMMIDDDDEDEEDDQEGVSGDSDHGNVKTSSPGKRR
jgi:hypothetical protein